MYVSLYKSSGNFTAYFLTEIYCVNIKIDRKASPYRHISG